MSGTRMEELPHFSRAIIGAVLQDLKYRGSMLPLRSQTRSRFGEHCTLNKVAEASDKTVIGDRSLLMAYVTLPMIVR